MAILASGLLDLLHPGVIAQELHHLVQLLGYDAWIHGYQDERSAVQGISGLVDPMDWGWLEGSYGMGISCTAR